MLSVFLILLAARALPADDTIQPTPARTIATVAGRNAVAEVHTPPSIPIVLQEDSPLPVEQQVAALCQTGSLLFSRGDCLVVKACTGSRYTHVATVVRSGEECWVYDSMNGAGVRKLTITDYLKTQAPDELTLYHPQRPFSSDESRVFRAALEQELGRKYDALHFVTGGEANGIHCAEYMTRVLMSIDWLKVDDPGRVSPGSLLTGIDTCGAYAPGEEVVIPQVMEPLPEVSNWSEALWQNTKLCCYSSCRQMSRWLLCR